VGGGGGGANPSYQAAVEAVHYSNGVYVPGQIEMLSFGTGRTAHDIDAHKASLLDWGLWVLAELLEDSGDWQTYVTRREYGGSGRVDFRRYQLDLVADVLDYLGVGVPAGTDLEDLGLDAVDAIDLLLDIGHAFADKIDFSAPEGLELFSAL
jgi:hypothetical protein